MSSTIAAKFSLRHINKLDFPPHLLTIVKSVLSGHSKIYKTKILLSNGSLMKIESIADSSPWSILQYF